MTLWYSGDMPGSESVSVSAFPLNLAKLVREATPDAATTELVRSHLQSVLSSLTSADADPDRQTQPRSHREREGDTVYSSLVSSLASSSLPTTTSPASISLSSSATASSATASSATASLFSGVGGVNDRMTRRHGAVRTTATSATTSRTPLSASSLFTSSRTLGSPLDALDRFDYADALPPESTMYSWEAAAEDEEDEEDAEEEYGDGYHTEWASSGSGHRGGFLPPPNANGTRVWPGPIPLPSTNITNGRETVEIYNAECFNITLGPVHVRFSMPLVISTELSGVGIGCRTDVAVRLGKHVLRRFFVELELGGSSLELVMALRQHPSTGFNATLEHCHSVITVTKLESSLQLINESSVIENYFETVLNQTLCKEFRTLINVNLTQSLRQGAESVSHYIDEKTPSEMFGREATIIAAGVMLVGMLLLLGVVAVWETLKRRSTPDYGGYAPISSSSISSGAKSDTAAVDQYTPHRYGDLDDDPDREGAGPSPWSSDNSSRATDRRTVLSAQPAHERSPLLGGGRHASASNSRATPADGYARRSEVYACEEPVAYEEKLLLRRIDAPLLLHFRLPWWVRYGLPYLLVINLFLFFSANMSVGASVYVVLSNPNGAAQLPSLSDFKLTNSVKEMWDAGAYGLSVLIAIFSGIWPYVKLLLMLFSWVSPSKLLAPERRGRILRVVDALGKWSLIDSYVLIMMMVSFRVSVGYPYGSTDVALDVYVQAQVGFYIFLVATMLSLLLSHVSVASHRLAVEPPFPNSKLAPREALSAHEYGMGKDRDTLLTCTLFGRSTISCVLLVALALLGAGAFMDSFSFVIEGLLGTALRWTGQPVARDFSVISLAAHIPCASYYDYNGLGVRTLQAVFIMFTLAFPLLHLLSLLLLWLMPLPLRGQYYLFVTMEIVNAWSALDVFVVSIIVSVLELTTFAESVVKDCGGLNEFMANNFPYSGYQTCFGVYTELLSGCWMLFCAVVIYTVCTIFCMNLCTKALRERMFRIAHSSTIQGQPTHSHEGQLSADWNSSHSDDDDSQDDATADFDRIAHRLSSSHTSEEVLSEQGERFEDYPSAPQSSSTLSKKLAHSNLWLAERALRPLRLVSLRYPSPLPSRP
jgi:Paraquat-inducible protein A